MIEKIAVATLPAAITAIGTLLYLYMDHRMKVKQVLTEKKCVKESLQNHAYFSEIEMIKNEVDRSFCLPNKGKEMIFKDVLIANLDILAHKIHELVYDICANEEKYESCTYLYNAHAEVLEEIVSTLYTFYVKNPNYTQEEKEIMRIVMKKYNGWSEERIEFIKDQIYRTCHSSYFANTPSTAKSAFILNLYIGLAIETVNNASATLNRINGDLKGLTYRGITL